MASSNNVMFIQDEALTADSNVGSKKKLHNESSGFVGWIKAVDTNAATTVAAKVEHSPDGVSWFDAFSFTNIVGTDSEELIQVNDDSVHLLPFVRSSVTLTGVTKESTVTVGLFFTYV